MLRNIRLKIDYNLCRACRSCLALEVCKVRALVKIEPDEPPYLDISRCYDCRLCIPACPFHAISAGNSRYPRQD